MRLLRKLTALILTLTVIIFVPIYFYQKSVFDNLSQKNINLTEAWRSFNSNLATRDNLLTGLTSTNFDSLKHWLQKSIRERSKKQNNLDLVFYEYKINKIVMDSFPNQKQVADLNIKLNNDISKYNSLTQEYNEYVSIFPNFIVAKHHYQRAKYFTINYGETNEDPINKSKELPEWAKGVDTN
jgi:hypothetical protein